MGLSLYPRGRAFSPPKTPAPGIVPSLSPSRYPNWSLDDASCSSCESSPEPDDLSRPSTSRSTETSSSLFSRLSYLSDDASCASPDAESTDKFLAVPSYSYDGPRQESRRAPSSKPKSRKAPWTKPMSAHLWATYVLYLQDPRVTPVRMGKGSLPPHGVCVRVAREAKRSWKGAKALTKPAAPARDKSGSSTPTTESYGAFIQWPHTSAATRAHLRDLCRLKAASSSGARGLGRISRSPTPFTHAAHRRWNRRSTPVRSPSIFTTQDMAVSLALSTSDAMHPQGPLAQLTGSVSEARTAPEPPAPAAGLAATLLQTSGSEPSIPERRRLGSPFTARSYGPSSSTSLAAALGVSTANYRRQSRSFGPRRTTLHSPARLSCSSTQKRRTRQSASREPRKRLSLAADFWTEPGTTSGCGSSSSSSSSSGSTRPATTRSEAGFSSTTTQPHDELFVPRIPAEQPLLASSLSPAPGQLAPPFTKAPPPRLGSPFSASSASFSFPARVARPANMGLAAPARRSATVQQQRPASRVSQARANLVSRLAYIDQRLKEFNNRTIRRRSESPL